jgi:hypothetical protein
MTKKDLNDKFLRVYLSNGGKEIAGVGNFYDFKSEGLHTLDLSSGLQIRAVLDTQEEVLLGFYALAGVRHDGREQFLPLDNGYTIGLSVQKIDEKRFQVAFRCVETTLEDKEDKLDERRIEGNLDDQRFIAIANINGKNRLVVLTRDGHYQFLDELSNLHKIIYVVSSETLALQSAVEELESLMNDLNAKEKDFQDFFERHRDFIHNDEYKDAHPHIVLSSNEDKQLIPDFVLEPVDSSSLCDILELKLPSVKVFVLKKNRMHFSAAVTEACAQLRMYAEFFDEEKNRVAFQNTYPGLRAYKPKMFVIIGRQGKIDPLIRRGIESDLPNITLRTYDEILNRAKWKIEAMKKGISRKYF